MRTVLVQPASIYAHFLDNVMCSNGHTSVDQISNKQLLEARGNMQGHIGDYFRDHATSFDSLGPSATTDQIWKTWCKVAVDSVCHCLGGLLASREDLSPPEAKVFRGCGNPIFTKVPLYQKPLPDFGTMNSKQMDRQLPLVKQYRRLQTLLNTARKPSSTNLHTSIQQWNAIVSHFTTLDYTLPADLQVILG